MKVGKFQIGRYHAIIRKSPFSKNHKCLNWTDYELTRYELEEAGSLCQANWIEIEQKNEYIQLLQALLDDHGIPYPVE